MRWTEGRLHVAMRSVLRSWGWQLVAGEFPGGSDHELHVLNIVDPHLARDQSPDPRRHSLGELIPDIVAIKNRELLIGEAKLTYSERDREKLSRIIGPRRHHLILALQKFAEDRGFPVLKPVESLLIRPALVFLADYAGAPLPSGGFSYLRIEGRRNGYWQGPLSEECL